MYIRNFIEIAVGSLLLIVGLYSVPAAFAYMYSHDDHSLGLGAFVLVSILIAFGGLGLIVHAFGSPRK